MQSDDIFTTFFSRHVYTINNIKYHCHNRIENLKWEFLFSISTGNIVEMVKELV